MMNDKFRLMNDSRNDSFSTRIPANRHKQHKFKFKLWFNNLSI